MFFEHSQHKMHKVNAQFHVNLFSVHKLHPWNFSRNFVEVSTRDIVSISVHSTIVPE